MSLPWNTVSIYFVKQPSNYLSRDPSPLFRLFSQMLGTFVLGDWGAGSQVSEGTDTSL